MNKTRLGGNRLLWTSAAAAALLSVNALPGQAFAQDGGSTSLGEIVVEGGGNGTGDENGGTGPVPGYVAKETTAGSKTATPIKEVPQAVSVLGRDEIDDRAAQKVDEALRYTAGVNAQPFGADSDTNWVFIRGFNATQDGTYQDGLQLQSFAFGGFFIDSFLLERIEVLKGPASVLYGGSNPGGVINYVSKRPTDDSFTRIEAGIDSFGTGYVGFDVDGDGGPAGGSDGSQGGVDYRVTGRIYGGDGYTDYSDQVLGTVSPSITWKPDEATSLTVLANYTHLEKTHESGFLPYYGTVEETTFGRIDRDFNPTEPDLDDYDREQGSIGYEFSHEFDNGWIVRQNARYGYASIEEVNLFPFGYNAFLLEPSGNDFSLSRINFAHDTEVFNGLVDNQIEGKFDTGAVNHTLLAGIDYKYFRINELQESVNSSSAVDPATTIDPTDPDYGLPQGTRVPYTFQDFTQNQLGAYVQDQLRFGDGWLVTLNGRYDEVWNDREDKLNGNDRDNNYGRASGRAGLAYEFANGLTPYASVATFFLPPAGVNASQNDALLEPETGQQYEVGLKYVPTAFDGSFTASLFDLTRQNVGVGDPANNNFISQIKEIRSRGVEFEGKAALSANLDAVAALTFLNVEITEDENGAFVGNRPFRTPEALASVFLNYTWHEGMLDGLSVGGGVRYVGESSVDLQNTLEVPDVTLADARIGYKKDSWGVDLTVTNLFDKRYVSSCQTAYFCYYGEARKALLKANFEW